MPGPTCGDLFSPALKAIHALGGSASIYETKYKVVEILNLLDDDVNEIHRGSKTKLNYRLYRAKN